MARGVNKVILIGNLGKDPESRAFPNGDMVANASLAVNETWTDKQSGERKEHVEWVNLSFRRKGAEIARQYLRKGSKVYIEGSLKTRKWQDKNDGKDRYLTEVVVHDFQMLDGKPGGAQDESTYDERPARSGPAAAPASRPPNDAPFEDDDIPFNS